MIQLEPVVSSLISHRGYDPKQQILYIRFVDKNYTHGSLYQYGNIAPDVYEEACKFISERTGLFSFGAFFQKFIEPFPKHYPYRKLEGAHDDGFTLTPEGTGTRFTTTSEFAKELLDASMKPETTADFASGEPLPVLLPTVEEIVIPSDPEELKKAALALQEKAAAIKINSTEGYQLASATGVAIARMRSELERTMRPEIDRLRAPYTAALAVFNFYNDPLKLQQDQLRSGMVSYKRVQNLLAQCKAIAERAELQRMSEQEAKAKAQELKLADAIEAEDRGETELAKVIMDSPALPIAPAYVPPIYAMPAVPKTKGSYHREDWVHEYVDERGDPVEHPRMDLIPDMYKIVDEKALEAAAKTTKNRTNIPGIRVYDKGGVSFRTK